MKRLKKMKKHDKSYGRYFDTKDARNDSKEVTYEDLQKERVKKQKQLISQDTENMRNVNNCINAVDAELNEQDNEFANIIKNGQNWLERHPNFESASKNYNEQQQKRMLMMCVLPTIRGMNLGSFAQSVGMFIGMSALSPSFRAVVRDKRADYLKNKYSKDGKSWEDNPKAQEKINSILSKNNGGRVPFTPRSAATQLIAYGRYANSQLRRDDITDEQKQTIRDGYNEASQMVYTLAEKDGISNVKVNNAVNLFVTRMDTYGITDSVPFKEMAYGDIDRCEAERCLNADGTVRYEWDGSANYGQQFGKSLGGKPFDGTFTLKEPLTVSEFSNRMSNLAYNHLQGNFKNCNEPFYKYMYYAAGEVMREHDDVDYDPDIINKDDYWGDDKKWTSEEYQLISKYKSLVGEVYDDSEGMTPSSIQILTHMASGDAICNMMCQPCEDDDAKERQENYYMGMKSECNAEFKDSFSKCYDDTKTFSDNVEDYEKMVDMANRGEIEGQKDSDFDFSNMDKVDFKNMSKEERVWYYKNKLIEQSDDGMFNRKEDINDANFGQWT